MILGRRSQIIIWVLLSAGLAGWWGFVFFEAEDKTALLPGKTSHGHYQIEMECSACHDTTPDGLLVSAVSNGACLKCHDTDLKDADDSHPLVKFKKPENRPFLEKIDAQSCVACHTEHEPGVTGEMGISVPPDYCMYCHQSTVEERESHKGLGFQTCATSGCHNYHDNRSLYEQHLKKHSLEPPFLENPVIAGTDALEKYLAENTDVKSLSAEDADAPEGVVVSEEHIKQWATDAHAIAGVNCSSCHEPEGKKWQDEVSLNTCATCHEQEYEGFLKGKHGMRIAAGLSPMTPGQARRPMKEAAAHLALDCTSCHGSHDFDTKEASYSSCVKCHDDEHTKSYENSPHFALWEKELSGEAAEGTGVSCATCHMPRVDDGKGGLRVEHNQNANLTPNEKMLRPVCQQCHGLPYAIDALSDKDLIMKNFSGSPGVHNESCDWSRERAIKRKDPEMMEMIRKMSEAAPSAPETE